MTTTPMPANVSRQTDTATLAALAATIVPAGGRIPTAVLMPAPPTHRSAARPAIS